MQRFTYSDLTIITKGNPGHLDHLTGILIKDGKPYFAGWTENSEDYNVKLARKEIQIPMNTLSYYETLTDAILDTDGYNVPMNTETRTEENPVEHLYKQHEPCTIIRIDKTETEDVIPILKDGYYIIIQ